MSIRPHNQTIKNQFLQELDASIKNQTFISLIMMNQKDGAGEISKISIRPVMLKRGLMLSFVSRVSNNDSTKNYTVDIGLKKIDELLENAFAQCELATTDTEYYLAYPEKGKGKLKKKTRKEQSELTANNSVKNSNIKDKYRQINKFINVIDPILHKSGLHENIRVVDMGSGKGYLSFALFDHLQSTLNYKPHLTGSSIVQYGILKERQAEIVTDTIRGLILKAYGYKTNVMEFISTDHTPKNLLIVAVKEENVVEPNQSYLEEIAALKKLFGITTHHLERLTINQNKQL